MLECPYCGKTSAKAGQALGKRLRCGGCKGVYQLPAKPDGKVRPVEAPALHRKEAAKPPSSFSPRRLIGGLAGLVPLLALGAAGWWWHQNYTRVKQAEQLNDHVVEASKRMAMKWDRTIAALSYAIEVDDPTDLRQALKELDAAVEDADRATRNAEAPDADVSHAFVEAAREWFKLHRRLVEGDLMRMVLILDDKSRPIDPRAAEIEGIAAAVDVERREALAKVEAAQRAFAERYNLKLR